MVSLRMPLTFEDCAGWPDIIVDHASLPVLLRLEVPAGGGTRENASARYYAFTNHSFLPFSFTPPTPSSYRSRDNDLHLSDGNAIT